MADGGSVVVVVVPGNDIASSLPCSVVLTRAFYSPKLPILHLLVGMCVAATVNRYSR